MGDKLFEVGDVVKTFDSKVGIVDEVYGPGVFEPDEDVYIITRTDSNTSVNRGMYKHSLLSYK